MRDDEDTVRDEDALALCGDDAAAWAREFVRVAGRLPAGAVDEDFVRGWFANAIERACDARARRGAARQEAVAQPSRVVLTRTPGAVARAEEIRRAGGEPLPSAAAALPDLAAAAEVADRAVAEALWPGAGSSAGGRFIRRGDGAVVAAVQWTDDNWREVKSWMEARGLRLAGRFAALAGQPARRAEVSCDAEPPAALVQDQPPPTSRPGSIPVWMHVISDFRVRHEDDLSGVNSDEEKAAAFNVLNDMQERDRLGRERYGTPLTVNNGRDQLVDAYQEMLDGSVYLRAAWLEGHQVGDAYYAQLDLVMKIRLMLDARAGADT